MNYEWPIYDTWWPAAIPKPALNYTASSFLFIYLVFHSLWKMIKYYYFQIIIIKKLVKIKSCLNHWRRIIYMKYTVKKVLCLYSVAPPLIVTDMSLCWLLGGLARCLPLILALCFQTESPPSGLFFQHKVDPWLDIACFSVANWSSLNVSMKKYPFSFFFFIFHHKQNCETQMNSPVAL